MFTQGSLATGSKGTPVTLIPKTYPKKPEVPEFYQTKEFEIELKGFLENYLCGVCRDKKRRER